MKEEAKRILNNDQELNQEENRQKQIKIKKMIIEVSKREGIKNANTK